MSFDYFLPVLFGWAGAAVLLLAFWLWQLRSGNAGNADLGWSLGLAGTAILVTSWVGGGAGGALIAGALAATWALRLSYYLLVDRVAGEPEDGRYRRMREYWGASANRWFFLFFQGQALLVAVFSLPFLAAIAAGRERFAPVLTAIAVAIWLVSVVGESIADRQLARFRANPENRGRTCRDGLWRYSRHPNYFFEWIHWWAYVVLAIGTPWVYLAMAGPVLMLFFLFFLTGIPYTEAQALISRGDDYRDYQRSTSVFFPWFPRSNER